MRFQATVFLWLFLTQLAGEQNVSKNIMNSAKMSFWLLVCSVAVWAQPPQQQGDGVWVRNAYYGEAQTFDKCLGHQPGNGQYHHHAHPARPSAETG